MKKFGLLIVLISLILFNGCKENSTDSQTDNSPKIKKISTGPDDYTAFTFAGNNINKEEIVSAGKVVYTANYNYDNGLLIKKEEVSAYSGTPVNSYTIFQYDGNKHLTKANTYVQNGSGSFTNVNYTTYQYDNNNIIQYNVYNSQTNNLISYNTLTYTNGNITEDIHYDSTGFKKITTDYEYDNKPNPLPVDISIISAETTSKNNIVKSTSLNYNAGYPANFLDTYTYDYNTEDYPVKRTKVEQLTWKGITTNNTTNYSYEYY